MLERLTPRLDLEKTVEVLRRDGVTMDIDGVDAETAHLSVREYNHLYGFRNRKPKTVDEVKHYWILVDWLKADSSIEDPLITAVNIWNSKKVMENADMVRGTQTVTKYLAGKGIVPPRPSSRPGALTREWTYTWYRKKYGPGFDLGLIRMHDGDSFDPEFKPSEIKRLGSRFHFDDSFEDAENIAKNGITVILVPQPWNLDYEPVNPRVIKVRDFPYRAKMVRAFLTLAEHITYL